MRLLYVKIEKIYRLINRNTQNLTVMYRRKETLRMNSRMSRISGVPRNFVRGGGVQQIKLKREDRENGDLGAVAPLVRGPGGSSNLLQEISFHIVKFS